MRFVIFLLCFLNLAILICQEYKLPNISDVGTVQFFRQGHILTQPIINLYGDNKLELRFDVFGSDEEVFYYRLELCDYNWDAVELDVFDYIEGYEENTFQSFAPSANTLYDYVHYRLILPNDDVKMLLPGNYKVYVYRAQDTNKLVLETRFIAFEEKARLTLEWDRFQSAIYEDKQQINAKITPYDISYSDMTGNVKLGVFQNNNFNSIKYYDEYTTDGKDNLVFDASGQIVFPGINEFRFFDMKSLKFISERVDYIDYKPPNYHVFLKPDKFRGDKQYFNKEDLNGIYFIGNQESHDPDTLDAEYAFVHFYLDAGMPLPADVYIEGAISNWDYSENFMEFNPETGMYEKILFLKQGLYNYRYATKEYNTSYYNWDITEGGFFQTNNNYVGIVYYRSMGDVYYKPVAVSVLDTK